MIELTRLNGKKFLLNAELVETVESLPDTTLRLTNGKTYVVKEDCQTVLNALLGYRQGLIHGPLQSLPPGWNVINTSGVSGNKEK